MTVPLVIDLVLGLGLAIAVATDLSTETIPNRLTFGMLLAGVVLHALGGTLLVAVLGFLAAFALHFFLWGAKVERGGDAKLMIAVGALVGWSEMFEATLWVLLLLLPFGLLRLALSGRLGNFAKVMRWEWDRFRGRAEGEAPEPTHLVLGGIIAPAVLLARLTPWLDPFQA